MDRPHACYVLKSTFSIVTLRISSSCTGSILSFTAHTFNDCTAHE